MSQIPSRHRSAAHARPQTGRPAGVRTRLAGAVAVLGAAAVVVSIGAGAAEAGTGRTNAQKGLVYAGLVKQESGPCAGGFLVGTAGGKAVCSHGPDPAPAGVDVTQERTAADLTGTTSTMPSQTGTVQCIDDGTTGPRVQAVYAVAADRTDRFATVAPLIAGWAGQMDGVVAQSAAATGGERHIRFVTNADCSLNVLKVTLTATGDDTFSSTTAELRAQGLARTDRKYVVWTDAAVYCGIGQVAGSDSASASNAANSGPNFARVDSGCWGRTDHLSEVHELMHTLGAVQLSAPHSTGAWHSTDESDAMSYADAAGVTMTQVCPLQDEWLLDCGHDDYFSTAPAAGSYLDTHWNVANSVFLSGGPTAPSGGSTTTTAPAPLTSTFTGTLSSKKPVKAFPLTVGSGAESAALSFTVSGKTRTTPTLILQVKKLDGTVVVSGSGPSVLKQVATLAAGSYTWEVSGSTSASFTLTVTYAAP